MPLAFDSFGTRERVMSHICLSHVTYTNESLVAYMNE
eukprot:CAMPEP_0179439598 /NCGR_PEP_ID=MMETSP0799-20121207/23226_1 /TAXON_ID=46947 /ORGANISM="Geminigera cryophila, Strain CCMP2564" /LENGTH=36 /DNA_ID= /DNA_START= /DNA_END= /DNA_ORIENTATION=